MTTRVSVDKRAIAKMAKEIQREFNRHPIKVPIHADAPELPELPGGSVVYNGPVVNITGDRAQVAWGTTVHQTQNSVEAVAPGFEALAAAVGEVLKQLPNVDLPAADLQDAEDAAREILAEVTQVDPRQGKIRRAVNAIKGALAPIASGMATGAAGAAGQEWARAAIEQLQNVSWPV